jgi:ABC-type transport system substrate-binding protein
MTRWLLLAILLPVWLALSPENAHAARGDGITIGFFNPISLAIDIKNIDSYESVFLVKQTAESLIEEGRFGEIVPAIARYWTVSKDMKKYTFHLHRGLRFGSGRSLTAHDVIYSIETAKSSTINPINYFLKIIESIEYVDELALVINLRNPWPGFLQCLSSGLIPIFSRFDYEINRKFIGSGSYNLELEGNLWFLNKNEYYVGVSPAEVTRFRILTTEENLGQDPDAIVFGSNRVKDKRQYSKIEIDSFVTFVFMLNPASMHSLDQAHRYALAKILFGAKKILHNSHLSDLKDIIPKGMSGHDIKDESYKTLEEESAKANLSLLNKRIIVGSFGPIPNFDAFARFAKQTYGIQIVNEYAEGRNYLEKLKRMKDVDVFAIGWGSIFSHPDAAFIPYYILGLENFTPEIRTLRNRITNSSERFSQHSSYRDLTRLLITKAYIVPQAQLSSFLLLKPTFTTQKSRYRYTIRLSEIRRPS